MEKNRPLFKTKNFGLLIGFFIFLVFVLLLNYAPAVFESLESRLIDIHFDLRTRFNQTTIQEGVIVEDYDKDISQDILIIGIDYRTISTYGKWPFPRSVESNLVNSFARIKDQTQRERALFLDIIFADEERDAYNDAVLIESFKTNDRVFTETLLSPSATVGDLGEELFVRQNSLYDNYGEITNVSGPWKDMFGYLGVQPPLLPYAQASAGYGHSDFRADGDNVYRKQTLVAKSSELIEVIRLDNLNLDTPISEENYERLVWFDTEGFQHTVDLPLTASSLNQLKIDVEKDSPQRIEDSDGDGTPDDYYFVVRKYQDHFVPSITLSLACEYFNKSLSDLEVVIGEYVLIDEPEAYNSDLDEWEPYALLRKQAVIDEEGNVLEEAVYEKIDELKIPIDEQGNMLINYMGPRSSSTPGESQTFPVRSFSGYASNVPGLDYNYWPRTKAVTNKLLLVGAFELGMADDEKPTPMGMMFGVEIHANALNTIIMDNFLIEVPLWINYLVLVSFILLIAFLTSRTPTGWAMLSTIILLIILFISSTVIFDDYNFILDFATPAIGGVLSFVSIVVYRVFTEESDKKRIRSMFGKYVSPAVVDQIIETPPELGGVDKELTVLFSDIRSFTTLSETMSPQELVNHLNTYLTAMTDCIIEMGGTLDKYVGDEIMCFWGAPLPEKEHAYLACKCALRQMKILGDLNKGWPEEKQLNIGIGLNSGIMTVGNMGSEGRMNYTLMGDNVNLGARLEGTNKQYLTNIIISEYTYEMVRDRFLVRELDNIRVKGKNKPVLIYELIDCLDDEI